MPLQDMESEVNEGSDQELQGEHHHPVNRLFWLPLFSWSQPSSFKNVDQSMFPLFPSSKSKYDSALDNNKNTTEYNSHGGGTSSSTLSLKRTLPGLSIFGPNKALKVIQDPVIVIDKTEYTFQYEKERREYTMKGDNLEGDPLMNLYSQSNEASIGSTNERQDHQQSRISEVESSDMEVDSTRNTITAKQCSNNDNDMTPQSSTICDTSLSSSLPSSFTPISSASPPSSLSTSTQDTIISSSPQKDDTVSPEMVAASEKMASVDVEAVSTEAAAEPTSTEYTSTIENYDFPRRSIPIFATDFQMKTVQNELKQLGNSSAGRMRHIIGKVIDILDHPQHADTADYRRSGDDIWLDSGKTLFLQQLILRLEEKDQMTTVAIICYDLNTEGFLLNILKEKNLYNVQRLNHLKEWNGGYGVMVRIKNSAPSMSQMAFSNKVDLAIIMDIRIQANDGVLNTIENVNSGLFLPIVNLITVGSVEQRLQEHFIKTHSNWQILDRNTYTSIMNSSNDKQPFDDIKAFTGVVVEDVMQWIESGMTDVYQFDSNQQQTLVSSSAIVTTTTGHPIRQEQIQSTNPELIRSSLVDDGLKKLFSHATLQTLQNELKSLRVGDTMHSSQQPIAIGDDEADDDNDSFYSAEDETFLNQDIDSRVQSIVDTHLQPDHANSTSSNSTGLLNGLKMEFDKKCLTLLENLTSTYQDSLVDLQNEYASKARKSLTTYFGDSGFC
ncbi:unnamed protein product [Absidia cylindrospora]